MFKDICVFNTFSIKVSQGVLRHVFFVALLKHFEKSTRDTQSASVRSLPQPLVLTERFHFFCKAAFTKIVTFPKR